MHEWPKQAKITTPVELVFWQRGDTMKNKHSNKLYVGVWYVLGEKLQVEQGRWDGDAE